jgi:DNA-binding transcriptional regulator YiaG
MQTKITTEFTGEELRGLVAAGIADAERAKREAVIHPILERLKYVTSSQAAELIGIKPATVRTWESDGRIKAYPTRKNEKYLLSEVLELAAYQAERKHRF